jgi:hypothetical protein
MFWAKVTPWPEATTDLGEIEPVIRVSFVSGVPAVERGTAGAEVVVVVVVAAASDDDASLVLEPPAATAPALVVVSVSGRAAT